MVIDIEFFEDFPSEFDPLIDQIQLKLKLLTLSLPNFFVFLLLAVVDCVPLFISIRRRYNAIILAGVFFILDHFLDLFIMKLIYIGGAI